MLPYSREVIFSLFGQLNSSFTVAQILALLLALVLAVQLLRSPSLQTRVPLVLLAVLWSGSSYFWYYRIFAGVNFLAPVYGALAGAQALCLLIAATLPSSKAPLTANRLGCAVLLLIALAWPLLDLFASPGWPLVRIAGLHAAPLLLLTLAILLRLRPGPSALLGIIPLLLSGVGAYQAYVLKVPQDWLPLLACFAVIGLQLRNKTRT